MFSRFGSIVCWLAGWRQLSLCLCLWWFVSAHPHYFHHLEAKVQALAVRERLVFLSASYFDCHYRKRSLRAMSDGELQCPWGVVLSPFVDIKQPTLYWSLHFVVHGIVVRSGVGHVDHRIDEISKLVPSVSAVCNCLPGRLYCYWNDKMESTGQGNMIAENRERIPAGNDVSALTFLSLLNVFFLYFFRCWTQQSYQSCEGKSALLMQISWGRYR